MVNDNYTFDSFDRFGNPAVIPVSLLDIPAWTTFINF